MQFRVATLNLEQDHKRWDARRGLIHAEIGRLRPDLMAFNEVCVPLQSARSLRDAATALTGIEYNLVQQTRVNGLSKVEGEALLTRFGVVETGNFDYQAKDIVALVARVLIEGMALDVYVTHLFMSRGDGSVSHPDRPRMDRCIDYIWVAGAIRIVAGGVCFNQPSPEDPSLWPSDHIGVWADLEVERIASTIR